MITTFLIVMRKMLFIISLLRMTSSILSIHPCRS